MSGLPREFARMLGIEIRPDASKQVVITELQGVEIELFTKQHEVRHEMLRCVKRLERLKHQEEVFDSEMWEHVEKRLGTPPDVQMEINPRTKQVSMNRDDADFLKIKYEDKSVHPEQEETDKRAFADHFHK